MRRHGSSTILLPGFDLEVSTVPLRRVVTRSSVSGNGRFHSRKMDSNIVWESPIELAFLLRAELDPTVTAIYAQALEVTWDDGQRSRLHYPDFVICRGGAEVHEAKADKQAASEKVVSRTAAVRRHLMEHGAEYGLAIGSALRAEPTFSNAATVARRLLERVSEDLARGVVAMVQDHEPIRLGDVVSGLAAAGCTEATVLTLVAHNRIHVDYRRPVDDDALLWANGIPTHHELLLPKPASGGRP